MAISFVGQASSATTTVTVPPHAVGDLIIIFAYRNATTAPSLGSGFTTLTSSSGNSNAFRVGYRLATSTSDASGTWTNANVLLCHVYRGAGSTSQAVRTLSSGNYAASVTATLGGGGIVDYYSGDTWVVAFAGSRQTAGQGTPLQGATVLRSGAVGTTASAMGSDTGAGTTGQGAFGNWNPTTSSNTTSVTSATITVELQALRAPDPVYFFNDAPQSASSTQLAYQPGGNGGSPVTGYPVERSTDGVSWAVDATAVVNIPQNTVIVSGMTPVQPYYYRVSAVNSYGQSAPSDPYPAMTGTRPSRTFDSNTSAMQLAVGSLSGWQYGTQAILLHTGLANNNLPLPGSGGYIYLLDIPNAQYLDMTDVSGLKLSLYTVTGDSSVAWPSGSGWRLLVVNKPSGTQYPRYWLYDFMTKTWLLDNVAATSAQLPDSSSDVVNYYLGGSPGDTRRQFGGFIAGVGLWKNRSLINTEVHGLLPNFDAWKALSPTALNVLDQASNSDKVSDSTGNGSDELPAASNTNVRLWSAPIAWIPVPPGTPTGVSMYGYSRSTMYVQWIAPDFDGYTSITGYKVEYSTNQVSWTSVNVTDAWCFISGLSLMVPYYVRVSCINSAGTGTPSPVIKEMIGYQPARTFTGNDYMQLGVGALTFKYGVVAAVVRVPDTVIGSGVSHVIANIRNPLGYNIVFLVWDNAGTITLSISMEHKTVSIPWPAGVHWRFVAVSKITGNVPAQFWIYDYETATWLADNVSSSGSAPDGTSGPAQDFMIGGGTFPQPVGDMAGVGVWSDQTLTSTQIHSLTVNWDAWMAIYPTALVVLDQTWGGATTLDLTGNGSDSTFTWGTSVISPFMAPIQFAPVVPDPPFLLSAPPVSTTAIQVFWDPPGSDGRSDITGYKVEYSLNGSSWVVFPGTVDPGDNNIIPMSMVVTGLTQGVAYWFRVSAVNAVGTSAPTAAYRSVILYSPVRALGAAPDNTAEFINFNKGALPGLTYGTVAVVVRVTLIPPTTWLTCQLMDIDDNSGNSLLSTYVLSDDVPVYRLAWQRNNGVETVAEVPWPAGTGWRLVVLAKGTGTVPVHHWVYDFDTSAWLVDDVASVATVGDNTGTVLRSTVGNYWNKHLAGFGIWKNLALNSTQVHQLPTNWESWLALAPTSLNVFDQATVTTAVPDSSGNGSSQSGINVTTVVPYWAPFGWAAPAGVVATATGKSTVTLTWTAVPGALSYDIERNGAVVVTGWSASPYLDTGLAPGTVYSYRVRAIV